jgi:geranylgeranyl diphosphate synthase type II
MPAACAVEMIHAYSLIHDDLPAMDDDALRRGRATCHRQFDEATAILAGDALQARAFEVLATEITPPATAAACCATLAEAAGRCQLVGGQADDMCPPDVERLGGEEAVRQLEAIHTRKTGALMRASLALGALTAGASNDQRMALDRFGRRLGLLFQVTDDLLDVLSNEKALGKGVGKDAEQGKLTYPALLGIEPSRQRAEQLVNEACEALTPLGPDAAPLEALARFVLERNR